MLPSVLVPGTCTPEAHAHAGRTPEVHKSSFLKRTPIYAGGPDMDLSDRKRLGIGRALPGGLFRCRSKTSNKNYAFTFASACAYLNLHDFETELRNTAVLVISTFTIATFNIDIKGHRETREKNNPRPSQLLAIMME